MAIRGVTFDLEGTVVDLERLHFDGFIKAAAELCDMEIDFSWIKENVPYAIGGGDQTISEGICRLSKKAVEPEVLRLRKMEHYNAEVETVKLEPRAGFPEVLKYIQEKGLPTAIGSLTPTAQARTIFEHSGVDKLFPAENIVLLEDVRRRKPFPDVYLESARRMGIPPAEQLVFEDSPTGVEAACAAGSMVVAMPIFQTPDVLRNLIQSGAGRIFFSWEEMRVDALLNMG